MKMTPDEMAYWRKAADYVVFNRCDRCYRPITFLAHKSRDGQNEYCSSYCRTAAEEEAKQLRVDNKTRKPKKEGTFMKTKKTKTSAIENGTVHVADDGLEGNDEDIYTGDDAPVEDEIEDEFEEEFMEEEEEEEKPVKKAKKPASNKAAKPSSNKAATPTKTKKGKEPEKVTKKAKEPEKKTKGLPPKAGKTTKAKAEPAPTKAAKTKGLPPKTGKAAKATKTGKATLKNARPGHVHEYREGSSQDLMFRALKDGKWHTFGELCKKVTCAKPKDTLWFISNHGRDSGLWTLEKEGKGLERRFRLVLHSKKSSK